MGDKGQLNQAGKGTTECCSGLKDRPHTNVMWTLTFTVFKMLTVCRDTQKLVQEKNTFEEQTRQSPCLAFTHLKLVTVGTKTFNLYKHSSMSDVQTRESPLPRSCMEEWRILQCSSNIPSSSSGRKMATAVSANMLMIR